MPSSGESGGGERDALEPPIVPQMGSLHAHLLFALAPPRLLHAARLRFYHEALHLHDVEEQLAHEIGIARVGHLETGTEPKWKEQQSDGR